MNSEFRSQNSEARSFTDSERLDWALRNHYQMRALYNWFGDRDLQLLRKKIDEEMRKTGAGREAVGARKDCKPTA